MAARKKSSKRTSATKAARAAASKPKAAKPKAVKPKAVKPAASTPRRAAKPAVKPKATKNATKNATTKATSKAAATAAASKATTKASSKPPSKAALSPGSPAPAFALRDQSGKMIRSSDFKGRKLLVYFYPKADTPGCTVQSCSVRDHRQGLKGLGVDVVGISPDAPKAQAKFDEKYRLGFPLLADEDHAVAEAFGAWGEKSMYGRKYMGIVRSSFLIDEKGRIAQAWYGVKPEETVPNARAAL